MLYLHLAPEQFSCNKEKIFWTLTFFKGGWAVKWSENLFHQEADTGIFPIQSWTDFEQQFQSQFFPLNVEADAVTAAFDKWHAWNDNVMPDSCLGSKRDIFYLNNENN